MNKHIFLDMAGPQLNNQGEVSSGKSQDLKEAQIPVSRVSARTSMGNGIRLTKNWCNGCQCRI